MSIRPVDFGVVQRSQDVSQIKQNENSRPIIQQQNIESKVAKDVNERSEQVNKKDDLEHNSEKYDAKEKSKGDYFASSDKKNKDQKEKKDNGKVFIKGQQTFDIKI